MARKKQARRTRPAERFTERGWRRLALILIVAGVTGHVLLRADGNGGYGAWMMSWLAIAGGALALAGLEVRRRWMAVRAR